MAKDTSGQGKLFQKVVNITEIRPQDQKTGQQKLFGQVEDFAPGFNEWAGMMNNMLHQTQAENKQLRQDVQENTAQSKRLATSLERIIPKFEEMSVCGTSPDLVVSPHQELDKADVATVASSLPSEAVYPFTTSDLAQLISMHPARLGTLLRRADILGDSTFHYVCKTGLTGVCQKYKMSALAELYNRGVQGKVAGIKPLELAKIENYLKMQKEQGG